MHECQVRDNPGIGAVSDGEPTADDSKSCPSIQGINLRKADVAEASLDVGTPRLPNFSESPSWEVDHGVGF